MPYSLTPDNDPTAVTDPVTGAVTHLCDLPGHYHWVKFPHADCNEQYFAGMSDEEKAKLMEKARKSIQEYLG